MEYTHQKTELSQILKDNNQYRVPNTNAPGQHTHVRTNWWNNQIVLRAQREVSPAAPRWTDLLGLGARQLIQTHVSIPPKKSERWQPVPSSGETGRIPETKRIRQLLGMSPHSPLLGPASPERQFLTAPRAPHHGGSTAQGSLASQVLRERSGPVTRARSLTQRGVSRCSLLKSQ